MPPMGLFSCFSASLESRPSNGVPAAAAPAPPDSVPQASPRRVQFEEPPSSLPTRHSAPASPSSPNANGNGNGHSVTQPLYNGPESDAPEGSGFIGTSPRSWTARSPSKSTQASLASSLRPFTDESSDAPVQQYIVNLGKHGQGLKEAVYFPDVGHIFGAAYRLHKLVPTVMVNSENAAMMAALGQDVVRALDLAGRTNVLSSVKLSGLLKQLQECCEMVEAFAKEGWLLHMAFNDHLKADFDNQHNTIIDTLEGAKLEVPGKPVPMPRGAYLDVNRNFRRGLKGFGGGSVAQGLRVAGGKNLDVVQELANQLGVTVDAFLRELDALPAEVPLDVYYARMVVRAARTAEDRYKAIFNRYDKGGKGYLDRSNLQAVLSDVGALEGLGKADVEAAVARGFSLADRDSDGKVDLEEFCRYFDTLTCSDARKRLRVALGPHAEDELKDVFDEFASFGTRQVVEDIDCAHFVKLFKDCNLLGKDLTVTDIDLAFARAKNKGARRLNFDGFISALSECAERKSTTLDGIVCDILACHGPVARATKAGNVRLHDDKSTYTGVYAKGGPKVAGGPGLDLANMVDRSDAAAAKKNPALRASRTLPLTVVEKPAAQSMGGAPGGSMAATSWKRRSTIGGTGGLSGSPMYEMWLLWAQFGNGTAPSAPAAQTRTEMGVHQFIKMMRETGLLDRSFNTVQAELVFMKVRPKGAAKLSFDAFEKALALIAEAKSISQDDVENIILSSQGPMLTTRVN